ncbi:MAG TPA: serine/threonine-protein kinase [Gemmatimonadales bacterium]|nr:serine/threonine-protein kinase [Gemmatimonadales bacterium]
MPNAPVPTDPEFLALQHALKGRYSLVRELGRGGMGIVYLAHEVALERPVALKVLPPSVAARGDLRARFLQEARTVARLSHPNIVPIFTVDEVGDFVFFAMAYVRGETLTTRVRTKGPLRPADATRVLQEVAWALAYAHAQGIVHRDVKPDNVMLEEPSGRAMVMDFGIAHLREEAGITSRGEVIGTVEYMSPEQACGEPVDARSDLYSLGVVGYYALSGTLPFQAPTTQALLMKHVTQPAPPLATHPGIPSKLCQAVDRCLEKAPEQRFQRGEEFAEALGAAVEQRADVPVPVRIFQKRLRRIGAVSGIAGFYVLAPAITGAIALAHSGRPMLGLWVGLTATVCVAASPVLQLASHARPLLKLGYDHDDVALAIKHEDDRRREELRFEFGQKGSGERRLKIISWGAFGASAVLLAASGGLHFESGLPLSVVTLAAGGIAYGRLRARRGVRLGGTSLWERLWKGKFGRWIFKLGGIRLARPAISAVGRPTELVIGGAADELFQALPKATRKQLGDLPTVVRGLEADARTMRARINELNASLASVRAYEGHDAMQTAAGDQGAKAAAKRDALADDLRTAIQAAEGRLQQAVASLETIRLELLRIQGGVGSVDSLTADLSAARDLSDEISRLVEGHAEIERTLRAPG